MPTETTRDHDEIVKQERAVLEKYGLRWAVLAAWVDQIRGRGLAVPREASEKLTESRILISSGCFSSCQVGCLLTDAEGMLVVTDGSSPRSRTDFWLDLLGQVMDSTAPPARILAIPGVQVHLSECLGAGCACTG